MSKSVIWSLIGLAVVAVVVGFLILKFPGTSTEDLVITNFDECAEAGYPIMESYPRQCRTASGELFVEDVSAIGSPISGGCFVGGCSEQICSDQEGVVSTCEYREQYACYKTATCERQSTGACGWTATTELNACLDQAAENTSILGK